MGGRAGGMGLCASAQEAWLSQSPPSDVQPRSGVWDQDLWGVKGARQKCASNMQPGLKVMAFQSVSFQGSLHALGQDAGG